MEGMMTQELGLLLPEIFLAASAVLGLLIGSYLPRRRQWLIHVLAALACLAGLASTVLDWLEPSTAVFEGSYSVDIATNATRAVVLVSVLFVLGLTADVRSHKRETEFVVLLLLSALGTVILAGTNDLLLLGAAYLLASVPLYALAAFAKDSPGTEAGLKFYLLGALLGVTMLFGIMLLTGLSGGTDYPTLADGIPDAPTAAAAVGVIAVIASLLFKAGAVPAQFWVPDVTQGARPPVGAIVTTIPKIGAAVALYRLVAAPLGLASLDWPLLFAVLAAATMTLGNLAAFFQSDVRRLLAYSTISQIGYLLMAVAAAGRSTLALPSLLLYLAAYAVTNLGAFAVVCALPGARTLTDYSGLRRHQPWLALGLTICLLGLVGTPPTGVFAGKLTVFTAAFDAGFVWLVVLAAVNTAASVFYYLRWIAPAMRSNPTTIEHAEPRAATTAYLAAPASVAVGILAGPILAVFQGNILIS
ncbi:NADH-quinone oxidoreductase subunit N [Prauserella coralliicola]|uniref:NADH-quinone oxidoreductase subunit N n=2 Tax=Prauserella flavalba TaxID=1477506 RepID=A0A318LC42_9PSEU|nr:NADH-quinone oxidoreductase subunit N [Prauserella coralliicola]PXY16883.1 NADH-quinone oxidoreductase subunit N [Prauserella flavalba]